MAQRTINTAFYDAMFGDKPSSGKLNPLEQTILDKVRAVLNNPDQLNKHIPPLPVLVLRLLELTRDPHADFAQLAMVIEQDPSLSGRILQLANSSFYSRGTTTINSLEKAVSLLGLTGVSNIASTIIMEKIKPANPIYYKMFGKQIWDHSIQTAYACKDFAVQAGEEEFAGHFLGLIHDVGKIVIFNCLCQALVGNFDDDMPSSHIFKSLMSEMSVDISVSIGLEWELPAEFRDALIQQRTGAFSILGDALFKANILTELHLLLKNKIINQEVAENIMVKRKIDPLYAQDFYVLAEEVIKI
ncbi:MAG: HD-like signal output (HDOD) protein [Phenylobacterium sp.]|jgi:HD-like signal output (HDOD) protein